VVVGGARLTAAGLGKAAAEHLADRQDRHIQPGLVGAEPAAVGLVDHAGGFGAEQAWLYVAVLTVGSMISRGLAKASRSPDYEDRA
jgi:hypothetical protein